MRRPWLTVLPAIVLIAAAVAIGLRRDPVYSAEASINVGRVDVPAFTLQGVTIGNATLAAGYARLVGAPTVVRRAARKAKVSAVDARANLSASPIPNSTVIRVEADGTSGRQAKLLANGASEALISYVKRLTEQQQTSGVLRQFRRAQATTERRQRRLSRLRRTLPAEASAVQQARLDYLTAKLRSDSLGNRYLSKEVSPSPQNLLQLVVPASTSSSDRISVLERLVLVGLVVGLVLGSALALWVANRPRLRRSRT